MRPIAVASLAALSVGINAQSFTAGLMKFSKAAKSMGIFDPLRQKQDNPLQPAGFPGLAPRDRSLPPSSDQVSRALKILAGNNAAQSGNRIHLTDGVHIQYQGYDIFAQDLIGDRQTEIFELKGEVKLIGADAIIQGERVQVDFKRKTFVAEDTDSQIRPGFFKHRVLDDVYAKGGKSYGSRQEIWLEHSGLTTCNLPHPHFELDSEKVDLRPGRRILLRKVDARLFNHTLFRLPFLSIPLYDRGDRYLPEVGQSQDEGFYLKAKFGVPLHGGDVADTHVDLMTKLGVGLGEDYNYQSAKLNGYLKAYGLIGPSKTFTVNQFHRGKLGSLDLDVASDLQQSTYFNAPENRTFNTRWNLAYAQGLSQTRLGFNRSTNDSSGFSNLQQTINLNDSRVFTKRTKFQTDLALSRNASSFSTGDSVERNQLDVHFRGQQDLNKASAELEYLRSIPIGDTTNFFNATDKTPVFTLKSDSRRLIGDRFDTVLPFSTEVSLGEYLDPVRKEHISRGNFDFQLQRPDVSQKRFGFSFDGRFNQGIYSDETAAYTIGTNTGLRYRFGKDTGLNLRYSFLRQYGFTPLQFDRQGVSNFLSGDIDYKPLRSLLLAAQTGYDLEQERLQETAWQIVGVRAEWKPRTWFQVRTLATYDPFSHAWSNVRFDLGYKPGSTFVSIGAKYDGLRQRLGTGSIYVDGFKAGRLKTSMLLNYNGYSKQFDARHFSFTYDLHCAEAILEIIDNQNGFRPGTQIGFYLRLKAFPFDTPFGLSRRGAPLGTATGRDGF